MARPTESGERKIYGFFRFGPDRRISAERGGQTQGEHGCARQPDGAEWRPEGPEESADRGGGGSVFARRRSRGISIVKK